jgi:hypothetical protein
MHVKATFGSIAQKVPTFSLFYPPPTCLTSLSFSLLLPSTHPRPWTSRRRQNPATAASRRRTSLRRPPTPANRRSAGPRRPSPALCGVRRRASNSKRRRQPVVSSSGGPVCRIRHGEARHGGSLRPLRGRIERPQRRGGRRRQIKGSRAEEQEQGGVIGWFSRRRKGGLVDGAGARRWRAQGGSKADGSRDPVSSPAPLVLPSCGGQLPASILPASEIQERQSWRRRSSLFPSLALCCARPHLSPPAPSAMAWRTNGRTRGGPTRGVAYTPYSRVFGDLLL